MKFSLLQKRGLDSANIAPNAKELYLMKGIDPVNIKVSDVKKVFEVLVVGRSEKF